MWLVEAFLKVFGVNPAVQKCPDRIFKIHPSIGIARVGNGPVNEYFIGPQVPGQMAQMSGPMLPSGTTLSGFKNSRNEVRRQAAEFRIYEYERDSTGRYVPTREITSKDVKDITWYVSVANRKASGVSPGAGDLEAKGQVSCDKTQALSKTLDIGSPVQCRIDSRKKIENLGTLFAIPSGRLHVVGSSGISVSANASPILQYKDNVGWYDDVADGWIRAKITFHDNCVYGGDDTNDENGLMQAWVVIGPPDFAPSVGNVITLYDLLLDKVVQHIALWQGDAKKKIAADIHDINNIKDKPYNDYPKNFLRRAVDSAKLAYYAAQNVHSTASSWESSPSMVLGYINAGTMPKLWKHDGNGTLVKLTSLQIKWLKAWETGSASGTTWSVIPSTSITPIMKEIYMLERAALESCVGGGLFPGIEVSADPDRNEDDGTGRVAKIDNYDEPFRLKRTVRPGELTGGLAVPWQADFFACTNEPNEKLAAWWPAQRPTVTSSNSRWDQSVLDKENSSPTGHGGNHMVNLWHTLEFVFL